MPDYQGAANYAYHLDAGKFAALLARHAVQKLGVRHIPDHVTGVDPDGAGGIASVATRQNGAIEGDLFIDCTGHASLLIGGHMGVEWIDRGDTLFNDRALAAQVRSEEHTSELQSLMRISYAVFCLHKKQKHCKHTRPNCQQ